jgi:hypothetical protein
MHPSIATVVSRVPTGLTKASIKAIEGRVAMVVAGPWDESANCC